MYDALTVLHPPSQCITLGSFRVDLGTILKEWQVLSR